MMPGRNTEYSWSRIGYNGQAKDDEVYGKGNLSSAKFWEYDTRIMKRWNVDPLSGELPSVSPYSNSLNNPISMLDPDGDFPIYFNVRSFAPFNWFGPFYAFKGDGSKRPFSTSQNYGSRIRQITAYETTTMTSTTTPYGSISSTKYGARARSDAKIEFNGSKGNRIYTHLSGDDDASIPFVDWNYANPTHDIDLWTDIKVDVQFNKDGSSVLSLTGSVSGDGFPSSEAYITDIFGSNSIFLGVGAAKAGPVKGPTVTLAGDKKEKQFGIGLKVAVDVNGEFQGVYAKDKNGGEVVVSPNAWNSQFEKQDPKGN